MTKSEFLEILAKELERLEEVEHVSDLANNGRYEEVDAVVAEIDYSALEEYTHSVEGNAKLDISEIPGKRYLAFVIYLSGSEYDEFVMKDWIDLQVAVRECGKAGAAIAETMSKAYINEFDTFEELVSCCEEPNGDGEESGE